IGLTDRAAFLRVALAAFVAAFLENFAALFFAGLPRLAALDPAFPRAIHRSPNASDRARSRRPRGKPQPTPPPRLDGFNLWAISLPPKYGRPPGQNKPSISRGVTVMMRIMLAAALAALLIAAPVPFTA